MKDAYSSAEIAQVLKVSRRSVQERALKDDWPFLDGTNRNGGRKYPLATLPPEVKTAIALREAERGALQAIGGGPVIPDWSHQLGMARFRIVHEYLTHLKGRGKQPVGESTTGFLAAYNSGQLLPEVFQRLGKVSDKSLYRWRALLAANGDDYRCLCDRRGKWDKGGAKGNGQIGPEAEQTILTCWLTPNRPSVTLAWRAMSAILAKKGLPIPSERSVRRFLERFDQAHHDLVVLKRDGEKALKDRVGPYLMRDDKVLSVGDVLFADGHRLNFDAINPLTGKPGRMTLILWFDWRSRMPVGWEILPDENTIGISSALRMGILNLGRIPKVVYLDNGRSFKARFFSAEADLMEGAGLYARLGIEVQYSKPYEARTKIVERFFGTFDAQCARLLPSYRGRDVSDKPAYLARNEKYHAERHNDYVPTVAEVAEIFRLYVRWYGQQPHRGLDGPTPGQVFEAGRGPGVDVAELDRHFLFRFETTPRRMGFTIPGTKIRYESEALYGLNRPVTVTYSWADLSQAFLYVDGKKIGEARPVEMLNPLAKHFGDSLDLQKVAAANKRLTALKRSTLAAARELDEAGPGLAVLPFVPRPEPTPLRVVASRPTPEPEVSEADRARLEAVQRKALAAIGSRPEYEAPDMGFRSPLDRYDFLFGVLVKQRKRLTAEDADWMGRYEASAEYRTVADRYEQLRQAYGAQRQEVA